MPVRTSGDSRQVITVTKQCTLSTDHGVANFHTEEDTQYDTFAMSLITKKQALDTELLITVTQYTFITSQDQHTLD